MYVTVVRLVAAPLAVAWGSRPPPRTTGSNNWEGYHPVPGSHTDPIPCFPNYIALTPVTCINGSVKESMG